MNAGRAGSVLFLRIRRGGEECSDGPAVPGRDPAFPRSLSTRGGKLLEPGALGSRTNVRGGATLAEGNRVLEIGELFALDSPSHEFRPARGRFGAEEQLGVRSPARDSPAGNSASSSFFAGVPHAAPQASGPIRCTASVITSVTRELPDSSLLKRAHRSARERDLIQQARRREPL